MRPDPDPTRNVSSKSTDQFFQEIQTLSTALSTSNPRRHSLPCNPNPKPVNKNLWKTIKNPLKALSLLRQSRFDCTFSIQVHSICNLPSSLSSSAFVVHFKRVSDNTGFKTRPVKAVKGSVDFQETLLHNCSVYASRKGGVAKYESREFIVYVNLAGSTGYDFGKNRVEITKILPVVFEDLYGEKREGKWSTSFGLGGRARGAVLNVSFGYCVNASNEKNGSFRRNENLRGVNFHVVNENVDLKEELDTPPELKRCTTMEEAGKNECEELEFTVIEKGVEIDFKNLVEGDENFDANKNIVVSNQRNDVNFAANVSPITEMNELEPLESNLGEIRSNCKSRGKMSRSLSLDDLTESIASEFFSLLGLESSQDNDAESPREQLLKNFENEVFIPNSFDFSSMVNEAEIEHHKSRAKKLEGEESEALMRKWGLNEKVFEGSMQNSSEGFGSPINVPIEEPKELPPLGENLDSFIQTKDGGFLRSMSPSLFNASRNSGSLVMQASSPIVLAAEMGSDIMEILKGLASIGIEKLSMQASKLMPLEDITGKTMQQIAWEASSSQELCDRLDLSENHNVDHVSSKTRKSKGLKNKSSRSPDRNSEYVSVEDLAPLAMDKIEALSIQGLRIQSGMSDEEAPSNVTPQFIKSNNNDNTSIGVGGACGLQLLGVKDNAGDVDGLMGLSLTLDEWTRFDSGDINEEDKGSEKTTRILEAHHAKSMDFLRAGKNGGKKSGKKWGLLGNNFTVAIMVQLRDPLRNYEHVGAPMLALIQVERVVIPPKPKIYRSVFESECKEEEDDDNDELVVKAESKIEEVVPQFKITEVHIAGMETEPSNKKKSGWGNSIKPQSGSRWLLANGMGKSSKHPFMKSNSVKMPSQATTKVQPGETLWSISSRVHGNGSKWKELAALNPHIRNPNVIFPNETIKLR